MSGLRADKRWRIVHGASWLARLSALSAVASAIGACSVLTNLDGLAGAPKDPTDAGAGADGKQARADGAPDDAATVDASTTGASAITFVTSASAAQSPASSLTVTLPEAPRESDLLLAVVYDSRGEATPPSIATPPAGWTIESNDGYWWTFYAFAPSGAAASYTFTFNKPPAGAPSVTTAIAVYRGVDRTQPFDVRHANRCAGDGTSTDSTCTAPSVDTTRPATMLVLLNGLDGADAVPSWTAPAGMTLRADRGSVAISDRVVPSSGATGPVTAEHAVTGWSAYMNVVALAPSP